MIRGIAKTECRTQKSARMAALSAYRKSQVAAISILVAIQWAANTAGLRFFQVHGLASGRPVWMRADQRFGEFCEPLFFEMGVPVIGNHANFQSRELADDAD